MATKKISTLHTENVGRLDQLAYIQEEIWCFGEEMDKIYRRVGSDLFDAQYEGLRAEFDWFIRQVDGHRSRLRYHEEYLAERAIRGQHLVLDQGSDEPVFADLLNRFEKCKINFRLFIAKMLQYERQQTSTLA